MALFRKKRVPAPPPSSHMTKKCPECFAYLRLDAKVCHACGKGVGAVTPVGLAEKTVDVKGYVVALVAAVVFGVFMWWGFFTD
jgi:hypothetical protein